MVFVDTSVLRVSYEEWHEGGEHTVVLVHGWPAARARGTVWPSDWPRPVTA